MRDVYEVCVVRREDDSETVRLRLHSGMSLDLTTNEQIEELISNLDAARLTASFPAPDA